MTMWPYSLLLREVAEAFHEVHDAPSPSIVDCVTWHRCHQSWTHSGVVVLHMAYKMSPMPCLKSAAITSVVNISRPIF